MPSTADRVLSPEVIVEPAPGSEAVVKVEVPASATDAAIEQALRRLAQQVRLPGFRPGKAPAAVVERSVGWEAIRQEAIDDLLPRAYAAAVAQEDLHPVSQPQVTEVALERGEPFRFTARVVVRPKIELGDYTKIRAKLTVPEPSEEQVEGTLQELRRRYAQLMDAGDRGIEAQDVITAELTMQHGGDPVGTPDQLQEIDLERGDLLPGMADQLLGAPVGEERELTVTLPEEYPRTELRGEMVTITARIKRIQHKELPPLDDNLASIAGRGETLDELKSYIREQIAAELREEAEREQQAAAMDALMEITMVEIPEAMVEAEIDRELRDLEMRLSGSGLSMEQLLGSQGKGLEQFRGEQRQPAVDRVKLELALDEVATRERLEVAEPELEQALASIFAKNASPEQRLRAREPLRQELLRGQARRRLAEMARGETPPS